MAAELAGLGYVDQAEALQVCGTRCLAHACRCGIRHVVPMASCGLRVCPLCARRQAAVAARELSAKVATLSRSYPRLRWRLVTLTSRWDPADPEQVSVDGLRRRAKDLWRRWSGIWPELRRIGCVAAYVSCECSDGGHVHLHVLVLGPWLDKGWLAGLWRDFADVRDFKGVAEVCKYVVKLQGIQDWHWLAGEHRRVIHPRLAARWWAATRRMHLHRPYGALRAASAEPEPEPQSQSERPTDACDCGATLPPLDQWERRNTAELLDFLRRAGLGKDRVRVWTWPPGS